jgi:hypothetical protein
MPRCVVTANPPEQVDEQLLAVLLARLPVRPDAVARGRRVLGPPLRCQAEAVAATLVDCLVARRLP